MSQPFIADPSRTRSAEQEAAYRKSIAEKKCPFCGPTNEMPREIQAGMLYEGTHWRAWLNPFPYPGHKRHIVLAPMQHLEQPAELSRNARTEWLDLNVFLIAKMNLPGGAFVMRFGEHKYKGGSITHLHSHIHVPDGMGPALAVFFADKSLSAYLSGDDKFFYDRFRAKLLKNR